MAKGECICMRHGQRIDEILDDHPGMGRDRVAQLVIQRMSAEEKEKALFEFMTVAVRDRKRSRAQRVERGATATPPQKSHPYQPPRSMIGGHIVPEGFLVECGKRFDLALHALEVLEDLGLSPELLETEFFLPDGQRRTWGTATIQDHEARYKMLIEYASANIEAASRHAAAMNMISSANVTCLNEVKEAVPA
jgi:hypothetical protein